MAVTESYVQGPPDGVGKKAETTQVTTGQGEVQRQVMAIADPETVAARVKVASSTPGATDYGLVVRPAGLPNVAPHVTAMWVEAEDRLRVKLWNSATSLQAKLAIRFIRANDPTGTVQRVTKILSAANATRGGLSLSFPFGAAGSNGRTVTDANTTQNSGTITSSTANFSSAAADSDVGRAVTISGAATAIDSGSPTPAGAGPNMPTSLYQGVIASVSNSTTAVVVPNCTVTQSGNNATLIIEPKLLADGDGLELGDGWIVGVDLNFWQTETKRGQAYFECEVNRGPFNMHEGITLFRGYLGTSNHLSWPGAVTNDMPASGKGYCYAYAGTTPSAGANLVVAVPTNARWRIQSLRFLFTTSSTVADRTVSIRIKDGSANVCFDASFQAVQAASLAHVYEAAPGIGYTGTTTVNSRHSLPLPAGLELQEAYTIETSVANMQAADAITIPYVLVEEWIEP